MVIRVGLPPTAMSAGMAERADRVPLSSEEAVVIVTHDIFANGLGAKPGTDSVPSRSKASSAAFPEASDSHGNLGFGV